MSDEQDKPIVSDVSVEKTDTGVKIKFAVSGIAELDCESWIFELKPGDTRLSTEAIAKMLAERAALDVQFDLEAVCPDLADKIYATVKK